MISTAALRQEIDDRWSRHLDQMALRMGHDLYICKDCLRFRKLWNEIGKI